MPGVRLLDVIEQFLKETEGEVAAYRERKRAAREMPQATRPVAKGFSRQTGTWSDERVEKLKRLWSKGLSASEIASRMGGVSRNAVIGKANRLGLAGRRVMSRKAPICAKERRTKPRQKSTRTRAKDAIAMRYAEQFSDPQAVEPIPPSNDIPHVSRLVDLEKRDCRWPVDHDHGVGFCGREAMEGSSYCPDHALRSTASPIPNQGGPVINSAVKTVARLFGGTPTLEEVESL